MKNPKRLKPLVFGAMTLILAIYIFDKAINLNPLYPDGAIFWCMVITIYTLVWSLFKMGASLKDVVGTPDANGRVSLNFEAFSLKSFSKKSKIIVAIPWILFFAMTIYSSIFFSWKSYRDQLGQPTTHAFTSDIQPVDLDQVPIVDSALASKLADKKLGENPSLGSQVIKGEPTIQQVNGELLWAVPLQHSGFFKWITNIEGSAGYITVSATNSNDVEYVDDYKIKYQPNSYFLHDLGRYARFTSAPFNGITDFSFELDDSGVPHWIVSTYENEHGFALPEATGVIIINASTGESSTHKLGDIPEWVDRVQPIEFIVRQINNQGEYVHGFLNFSDKDKFRASEGEAIIYNDGRCYLFTGLTSVGNDESTIGFVMVDMVTKEALSYQMNGATEDAARKSAQGKVQNLGYYATFPIIINAENTPTYFMTLKDQEGLVKQYAMVSVENYSIVGVGDTVDQAHRDYQAVLRQSGLGSTIQDQSGETESMEGTVLRIASQYDGSQTIYFVILEESPDKIYSVEASISSELALTETGDSVSMSLYNSDSPIVLAHDFDNLEFTQK